MQLNRTSRGMLKAWAVAGTVLMLSSWVAAAADAESKKPPLAWTNVTAILDQQPAVGRERELANVPELLGKAATLPLTFLRAEQDEYGKTRYVYECNTDRYRVTCFVKGAAAGKPSGLFTGRITRARFLQADLRGTRFYMLWLDADTFAPAP